MSAGNAHTDTLVLLLIAGLSRQLLKLVSVHVPSSLQLSHTHTAHANAYIHTASTHTEQTHHTHTQLCTNIHGSTHTHAHTPLANTKAATHSPR